MSLTPEDRALEKALRQQQPGLLDNLPGEKKQKLLRFLGGQIQPNGGQVVFEQRVTATSSPVPPAELLMGYNAAIPNGAERLFQLVENQSTHRQAIETKVITEQLKQSARGQIFGLALAVIFGVMGFVLVWVGERAVGLTIFGTTVTGLVVGFLGSKQSQSKSLDKKAPDHPTGKKKS